jgi:hypothetical protein
MTTANEKLPAKQEKLIAALLTSATVQAAAATAGVSEATAHRWLRDDAAFAQAYRQVRWRAVQHAIVRLQQTSGAAVTILLSIAADKSAPASSRVTAASKLIDLALRSVEIEELEARLSALEATVKEK